MSNKTEILTQNNFKLYIEFKDNIIFENELINKNIDYYRDEKSIINFRYFFLSKDSELIDLILKTNNIVANIESLPIPEFNQTKKIQLIYLKVAIGIIII
ncbi:hypothetical protein EOD40_09460 [Flavobacterium sufflavum]|uniref:Uncharacterized protein n=1 Tax=Flavobacterium sufflavum TaxID=1921138 RepID=A0A3S3SWJ5_9FLAO|nr:hypothetical protein [Flavobacterium sufflavum]RVT76716.1 hypothetical protein EOD40_09460 [Flavobacterium sufflavum]